MRRKKQLVCGKLTNTCIQEGREIDFIANIDGTSTSYASRCNGSQFKGNSYRYRWGMITEHWSMCRCDNAIVLHHLVFCKAKQEIK